MNNIDKIINFINSSSPQSEQVLTPKTENNENNKSVIQESPTSQSSTIPTSTQSEQVLTPKSNDNSHIDEIISSDKLYKSTLRKISKIKQFPAIVNQKVINDENELHELRKNMLSSRRAYMKDKRKQNIEKTKPYLKNDYESDDEDIEEDGVIYKKGPVKAVIIDNKKMKVAQTSSKDRLKIYNRLKDNKEALVSLVKADDDEQFERITEKNLDDEHLDIYNTHKNNSIQNDRTWTRDEFIKFMNRQMMKSTGESVQTVKHNNTSSKTSTSNSLGLNPLLFSRF